MNKTQITRKLRRAVAEALKPTYFESLSNALNALVEIVKNHGISTDGFDGFYCGADSRTSIELPGLSSVLVVTWHRMESGRMEVVGYVS